MEAISLLGQVQKTLKAPKGQFNEFGKYKYRSCEDILEAVKPILPEKSIITITDDLMQIGERYYVRATATFHCENDKISVTAYARESDQKKGMDSSQITGSASSYARKYALNGLLLIDDTKDADTTDNREQPKKTGVKAEKTEQATLAPGAKKDPPRGTTEKPMNRTQDAKINWLCQQKGMDTSEADKFKTYVFEGFDVTEKKAQDVIDQFDSLFETYLDSATA